MNTPNRKGYYISQLVISSVAALFLLQAIIKNPYPLTKLIIGAVFFLVLINVVKTLFMVLDKPQGAAICNKIYAAIFALYWFGFLVFITYLITRDGAYLPLIFTIPFWIAGIYMVYKVFFKEMIKRHRDEKIGYSGVTYNEASYEKNEYSEVPYEEATYEEAAYEETAYTESGHGNVPRASQSRSQAIAGGVLVGICLIAGVLMLFFGIRGMYRLNKTTKDYVSVDGYFSNYDVHSVDEDGTTYRLTYTYTVDGVDYEVTTDYGTGSIPTRGSVREVKYNPANPAEAILKGTNGTNFLIYIGAFFTMIAVAFILVACSSKGWFERFRINVLGLYFGIIFTVIGVGVLVMQIGTTGSFAETIKSMHVWIIIPIAFIIFGIWQTIRSLFPKREEEY